MGVGLGFVSWGGLLGVVCVLLCFGGGVVLVCGGPWGGGGILCCGFGLVFW